MIQSLYQIDFLTASGTTRLLSYGDYISDEISAKVAQAATQYRPLGAAWAETVAAGGATVSVAWTRREDHANHAALRSYCLRTAATSPASSGSTGTLRLAVQGGERWDIADCTITSCEPAPLVGFRFRTVTSFQALGGAMTQS